MFACSAPLVGERTRRSGVHGNGDPIFGRHPAREHLHRCLQKIELVRALHGAGDVDQKDEIGRRQVVLRHLVAFDPHVEQMPILVPGARPNLGIDGKRHIPAFRSGITIREVVDQLLHPHRIVARQGAAIEQAPDVAVRGGIHVDGKRRYRGLADQVNGIGVEVGVGLPIQRLSGGANLIQAADASVCVCSQSHRFPEH
jgi:hypothetical protein